MTTSRIRRASALAAAALMSTLALAACGSGDGDTPAATNSSGVTLITAGKLKACTHLSYKPFEFKEGSKVVGFDVDLMDLVAKKLGVEQTLPVSLRAWQERKGGGSLMFIDTTMTPKAAAASRMMAGPEAMSP